VIIRKYGITLSRLTEDDIELVRVHRNSDEIRLHMFYQEMITPEMQVKWFQSINNIFNHYFIIEHQHKKIGMVFSKNDDYEERTTEAGIFIWDKHYLNSYIPVIASYLFTDLGFRFREMKKIVVELRLTNTQAINYVKEFGYRLLEEFPENDKAIYYLTKDMFEVRAEKIKNTISKITKDYASLSENDIDTTNISKDVRGKLYVGYPEYLQLKIDRLFEQKNK